MAPAPSLKNVFTSDLLRLYFICALIVVCSGESTTKGCQHRSTLGRDYKGTANTANPDILCQKWSDSLPHAHPYAYVGDHNYCRNPVGVPFGTQLWCLTTDSEQLAGYCDVPFCPPLKILDFSLDYDWETDDNGDYSLAFLKKWDFPSSFTICTAFMVKKWGDGFNSPLFLLHDQDMHDNLKDWLYIEIYSSKGQTEFSITISDIIFTVESPSLFFPMQWTHVCFAFDSKTSMAAFVVDGTQLLEKNLAVAATPWNLDLVLGFNGPNESPGLISHFNIFSSALSRSKMESITEAGNEECGTPGDFVNWNETDWEESVQSEARVIEVDSALEGPCRRENKMHIYPMIDWHDHSDCMQHCDKLGGQSPPVGTLREWQTLYREVQHISPDPSVIQKKLWMSATEGEVNSKLAPPRHWPKGTQALETV